MDWKTIRIRNPIESEIVTCEQKITSEKANFGSNTVFSLYLKIRVKKFHAAKPLAPLPVSASPNHHSNLTSKIMIMCEQILKKDSAPIQFKFVEL